MERPHNPITIEELKDNETLLYFTTLIDDDRIDTFLEKGDRRSEFDFISTTALTIHPDLLPKNHIDENDTSVTAYAARGCFTDGEQSAFHLEITATKGEAPHSLTIKSDLDNSICLYERNSTYFTGLTLKDLGDLSLRVASTHPNKARRDLRLKDDEPIFSSIKDINAYWTELAQEKEGTFTTAAVACSVISASETESVEIRLAQKEDELPRKSVRELIIEHATQMHALDAEIVHRLELRYESVSNDRQGITAEKRVVSGCERRLVNARLTSRDRHGRITPLDIHDDIIMKQFQALIEVALQDS